MMFGRPTTRLQLEVPLSPERVEERLRSSMRIVPSLLFSPDRGAVEPFVGRTGPGFFEMRVRHWYSNSLARLLYGRLKSTPQGTRVDAQFKTLWWVVLILRLVWVVLLLGMIRHVARVAESSARGFDIRSTEVILGIAVPAAMLTILFVVEVIGTGIGDRDEERMRRHLRDLFKN